MPYSHRYVMQQLARGRPLPTGQPEDHLHQALARLDPGGISQAMHMGARVDMPHGRAGCSAHILLDAALAPDGTLAVHPARFVACVRELARNHANFNLPHPASCMTAVGRMAALAGTDCGAELHALLRPRVQWSAPTCPGGASAREAWEAAQAAASSVPTSGSNRPRVR